MSKKVLNAGFRCFIDIHFIGLEGLVSGFGFVVWIWKLDLDLEIGFGFGFGFGNWI